MTPFRSIVVGTDGSPSAGRAVARAAGLAALLDAALHIVSAYEPDPARLEGDTGAVLDALRGAEDLARGLGVARTEVHAFEGDPVDALLDAAVHARADLIVVGDRGMQRTRRFGPGSVPDKVSHRARCSVLLVSTAGPSG